MIKKVVISSIILLFVLMPFAYADWVNVSTSGDWDVIERTTFKTPSGQYFGDAIYQIQVENFTGYHASIYLNKFETWKLAWWHWDSYKNFMVRINFTGSNWNASIRIDYSATIVSWFALYDTDVDANAWLNGSISYSWGGVSRPNVYFYPNGWVEVYFSITENQTINYGVYEYQAGSNPILLVHYSNNVLGDFNISKTMDNVTITLEYKHENVGIVDGWLEDTIYQGESVEYPTNVRVLPNAIQDFFSSLIQTVNKILPQWLKDSLATIWGFFSFVGSIFMLVLNIVGLIMPHIGFIILFWILDAIITSVNEGNLQPIGNVFTSIFEIGRGIYQTIANIIEAIWNVIHFW